MKKIGRTDPTTPIAGRTWYAGAWRTPEEIEQRREYVRSHRKRLGTEGRAKREAGERMRDRSTPVPGRRWYAGRWRTEDEIVRVRERTRLKNRRRYVKRERPSTYTIRNPRAGASPEERARREAAKRLAKAEARRAQQAARDEIRAAKVRARTKAPTAVRDAWKRAHVNSVIRRKYPTLAALDASVLTQHDGPVE